MNHLLVDASDLRRSTVEVEGDDYRHLFRARRLAVGDRLRLVDGCGHARWSQVERVSAERAWLQVGEQAPVFEPVRCLTLWVSPLRPERAAWLVEKVTELGIRELRWLVTARSSRSFSERRLARQRRVAKSALEQSGGAWMPRIEAPIPLAETGLGSGAVVLHPSAEAPLPAVADLAASLVIGPEGGLADEEIDDLVARGAVAAHLGSRVLRTETAAVVATAVVFAGVALGDPGS